MARARLIAAQLSPSPGGEGRGEGGRFGPRYFHKRPVQGAESGVLKLGSVRCDRLAGRAWREGARGACSSPHRPLAARMSSSAALAFGSPLPAASRARLYVSCKAARYAAASLSENFTPSIRIFSSRTAASS